MVYVFTHRDQIRTKGVENEELLGLHTAKLIDAGIITRNVYVVSSKIFSDVHVMFKKEIQYKLTAGGMYK